jgi:hypothetical protein
MERTRLQTVATWALSARVRRLGRIATYTAFALIIPALLWTWFFGPRGGALVVAGGWGILLLLALACIGIMAVGGLEQLDPTTARLGHRLGHPRVARLADLWGGVGVAAIAAGNVVVNLTAPAPGGLGNAVMIPMGVVALTPLLVLYVIDWVRTQTQRRNRDRRQAGDTRSEAHQ